MSQGSTPVNTPPATRPWGRKIAILGLALTFVTALALWLWWRTPLTPPEIDSANVDLEVANGIEAARREVLLNPHAAEAWGFLGATFHAYEFKNEALACYAQAERLDAKSADWPYLAGLLLSSGARPAEGIAHLERAAQRASDSPLPRIRLGEAYLELGRVEEAVAQFQLVVADQDDEPRARLRLAQIAANELRWQDCLRHLERSAVVANARAQTCALRLRAYQALGDQQRVQTQQRLQEELPEDPPWPDPMGSRLVRLEWGVETRVESALRLVSAGRSLQGLAVLEATAAKYPDSAMARDRLGRVLLTLRRYPESERTLQHALTLAPRSADILYFLGLARLQQGKFDQALDAFQRAVELKPADPLLHCMIGSCESSKGNVAAAAAAYREALRHEPGFAVAVELLGKLKEKSPP